MKVFAIDDLVSITTILAIAVVKIFILSPCLRSLNTVADIATNKSTGKAYESIKLSSTL